MQIRKLTNQDSSNLLNTINDAFADYIVPFHLNSEQLEFKIVSENIHLEWSIGVFEADKLIAFIMHGVRTLNNSTVLYNAGTGVMPEYRGQGLVGKMYDYILPYLEKKHVNEVILEVIEDNKSAIRAYEKKGFSIQRKLLCFSGVLKSDNSFNRFSIQPLESYNWELFTSFWDIMPSWQNAIPTIDFAQPRAFGTFFKGEFVGYILFNPSNKRVYQLAIANQYRRKGAATQLLAKVQQQIPNEKIKITNIDQASGSLKLFLEKQGLINDINQFEMIKNL